MKSILDFQKRKELGQKISMVTCYDYSFGKIIEQSPIDAVLIGDSVAQVLHGHNTTLNASTALIALHTAAVSRAIKNKIIVSDMPFLANRKSIKNTMDNVEKLMKAGSHAIKIENADGNLATIKHIIESGVPIMGHLGLTPQSINQLGGTKVQGRNDKAAEKILSDALRLQDAGCFSLVLECVPEILAKKITATLSIPTIGIGAGVHTDGQILVLQDLLGFNPDFKPKFLKKYLSGYELISDSLKNYVTEVTNQSFPAKEHSYE